MRGKVFGFGEIRATYCNPSTIGTAPRWRLVTVYVDQYLYYDVPCVAPGRNNAIVIRIDVYKALIYLTIRINDVPH